MNTEHFKTRLEDEQKAVEAQLATVGRKNPDRAGDWEATAGGFDADPAEAEEEAQKFQEEDNNEHIVDALEKRLAEVKRALGKIVEGAYGMCEISGEHIEEDRLDANPAARTCKKHLDEEAKLSV